MVVVIVVDLVLLVFPFNFAGVRKYNTGGMERRHRCNQTAAYKIK